MNAHESQLSNHIIAPKKYPRLIPFVPMLYVAWADGVLTPSEFEAINTKIVAAAWLTAEEQQTLRGWLNPASPPSPRQLQTWLRLIRQSADRIPVNARNTLSELGIEIARISSTPEDHAALPKSALHALREIEFVLGIPGEEAASTLLADERPQAPEHEPAMRGSDRLALQLLLDGEHRSLRNRVRTMLSDPAFAYLDEPGRDAYREKVLEWTRLLAEQGFGALSYPENCGGRNDIAGFIAVFETLACHDLSTVVKFGVQFGLFGGSILNLGTKTHHENYLSQAGSLELPGCFAMTETGHGSNVRDIETVARYDRETQCFIVNTPNDDARKDYIGNAACHGRLATVFAQLEIDDEGYGVHAFLVPIRDAAGDILPGVRIEDCGSKLGLNGVDNGRLWFDTVRIPRENLLDRFAQVSPGGIYTSDIPSPSARFFTMLGTLVGGRISIAAASLTAAKSGLTIAVRYGNRRRQFGAPGKAESLLLDYPSQQRLLLPALANCYALDFAIKHLVDLYAKREPEQAREIESLAAGLKAWSSWFCVDILQTSREACGGKGYLAENRFAQLKADTDIFTTFEGANAVLLQLVAKSLLSKYRQSFSEDRIASIVRYLGDTASTAILEMNPVAVRMTDEEHLRDPAFHHAAFEYREKHLLTTVAGRLRKKISDGMASYDAFIACQPHLMTLAKAHVERIMLEQFQSVVTEQAEKGYHDVLSKLLQLFALARIEQDRGWFLESGYIEGNKAKAIRKQVKRLCAEIRPYAEDLVDAFGIPDACLSAPIAMRNSK